MNTLAWLTRLMAFDTTSRNSNGQLIDHVQTWLQEQGIAVRLTQDATQQKTNLFATMASHDGQTQGGLILSGHTDVVPVDGQQWDTDPFVATLRDGKVYGRGACDMKGFLAVVLALVPEFKKMPLVKPLHLAFSYDEEVGCVGAPVLIADLQKAGIQPDACVVGEPTSMRPIIAHKGIQVFRCRIHGRAAHSSLTPQGCNAIEYAAQLICYIRELANQLRQEGPFDPLYDVPFTTVSTNKISGGIADNIIPELCEFFFEFRNLPEVNPKNIRDKIMQYVQNELLPNMQAEHAAAAIQLDQLAVAPSFESKINSTIYQWVQKGHENKMGKVAYATEAGLFQRAEIPTIVCGPGSIEQAHRPNEYVAIEQLDQCAVFLREIVRELC